MCNVELKIPEEVMYDTKMNEQETSGFVRGGVALGHYIKGSVNL